MINALKDMMADLISYVEDNYYLNSGAWMNYETDEYKSKSEIVEEFLEQED